MAYDGTEQVGNWIIESCVENTPGEITLTGSDFGYARFRDPVVAGKVFYIITVGDDREAGVGDFNGTDTIVRSNVQARLVNQIYTKGESLPPIVIPEGVDASCACAFNARAFKELWDHVFNLNNPHGVTAAQVPVDDTNFNVIGPAANVQDALDNTDDIFDGVSGGPGNLYDVLVRQSSVPFNNLWQDNLDNGLDAIGTQLMIARDKGEPPVIPALRPGQLFLTMGPDGVPNIQRGGLWAGTPNGNIQLVNPVFTGTFLSLIDTPAAYAPSLSLRQNAAGDALETGSLIDTATTPQLNISDTAFGIGLYAIPLSDGTPGQILKTDGLGVVVWQDDDNTDTFLGLSDTPGIYVNNALLRQNALGTALESGGIADITTQKQMTIADTGLTIGVFTLPLTDGLADQLLQTDGGGVVTWRDPPAGVTTFLGLTDTPGIFTASRSQRQNAGATALENGSILDTATAPQLNINDINLGIGAYAIPLTDGAADQLLQTDGLGDVTWRSLPTPPPSTPFITQILSDVIGDAEADVAAAWNAQRNSVARNAGEIYYYRWPSDKEDWYILETTEAGPTWTTVVDDWLPVSKLASIAVFNDTVAYFTDDLISREGGVWRAIIANGPGAFNAPDWAPIINPVGTQTQFSYEWNTANAGDPTSGHILATVTPPQTPGDPVTLHIHKFTGGGFDVSAFYEALDAGDYFGFEETTGNHESAFYQIVAAGVDLGTYFTFTCLYIGGVGTPDNNGTGVLSLLYDPASRIPAGGTTDQVLTKLSSDNYDMDWTTPISTFLGLTDTPATYDAFRSLRQNSLGTALENGSILDTATTPKLDINDVNFGIGAYNLPLNLPTVGQVLVSADGAGNIVWTTPPSGVTTFLALSDTPGAFTASRSLRQNAGATALEDGGLFDTTTGAPKLFISNSAFTIGAFTLPLTDGVADQVLVTNGLGVVTWQNSAGGVSSVAAGDGLTGGGVGAVTLDVGAGTNILVAADTVSVDMAALDLVYEPIFSKNTGFNKNFGAGAGTVSEGNHLHSGVYEPIDSNITRRNVAEVIPSVWTFNGGVSGVSAPFIVDSTWIVNNLNADLVDGLHATSFLRSNDTDTATGVLTFTQICKFTNGVTPFTVSGTGMVTNLNADRLDGNHASAFEPAFSKNTGFNKAFGTGAGTVSEGNHLHTGVYEPAFSKNTGFNKNYGTGSGNVAQGNHLHTGVYLPIAGKAADSELLDGINSTQFLRSDTADTATGVITFSARPSFTAATRPFDVTATGLVTNLNADRVDNIHASSFLRSDAADTASGLLTLNGGIQGSPLKLNATNGNNVLVGTATDNGVDKVQIAGSTHLITTNPRYAYTATNAASDEKQWEMGVGAGQWRIAVRGDTGSFSHFCREINRTGLSVDNHIWKVGVGVEAMRLDSTGLLIGTTTNPSGFKVNIVASTLGINVDHDGTAYASYRKFNLTGGSASTSIDFNFNNDGTRQTRASIGAVGLSAGDGNGGKLSFYTANTSNVNTERLTIDANGHFGLNIVPSTVVRFRVAPVLDSELVIQAVNAAETFTVFGIYGDGRCTIQKLPAGAGTNTVKWAATGLVTQQASARRYKEDFAPIPDAMAKVAQLIPCTYTWVGDPEEPPERNPDKGRRLMGFVAEEVRDVEVLAYTDDDYDDRAVIALAVAAIKELHARIEVLEAPPTTT